MGTLLPVLGKYAHDRTNLVWILSIQSWFNIITANSVFTRDKYGGQLPLYTAEVGQIWGTPIITSEHIKENLNASGYYDDSTGEATDRTVAILVHKDQFKLGEREGLSLETYREPIVDQTFLVVKQRMDFQPVEWDSSPVVNTVALLYNIKPSAAS